MNFFDGYKEGIFVDLLFGTVWESLFVKKLMIKLKFENDHKILIYPLDLFR